MGFPSNIGDRNAGRRPFQYSLRSMFLLMTAAAIGLSLLITGPAWLSMLTVFILGMGIPMALTISLVYSRGPLRTFSIGALFPAGVMLMGVASEFSYNWGRRIVSRADPEERLAAVVFTIGGWLMTIAFGLLALGLRKIVEARVPQHGDSTVSGEEPRGDAGESPSRDTEPE